jgi:sec-independent protein translocase protein TatC
MGEESEATPGSNISTSSSTDESPEPPDETEMYAPENPENVIDDGPAEPLQDEEMPLADHIEEMIKRLAVVLVVAGTVSVFVFPVAETVINFLWNSILPVEEARPRLFHPLALVLTELKVASLAGLVVALPVMVYQTYLFMKPGLYPHERRYYLAAVPTSLVLAFVGLSFAYFLVLPAIFTYFLSYTQSANIAIAFGLTKTFNLILMMMGVLAVVFQIPLLIMLAIMMGLTTRRWLAARRLYFWGGFLGFAFLFSPDPTGMAPFMVALTMVGLFEGTLLLLKWTGR